MSYLRQRDETIKRTLWSISQGSVLLLVDPSWACRIPGTTGRS